MDLEMSHSNSLTSYNNHRRDPRSASGTTSRSGSRHRSRSRSSRRRHRRRHRRSRSRRKIPERNFLGAAFSMISFVGISAALAESDWFTFHGGDCHDNSGNYLTSMGISNFFISGQFNDTNPGIYSYKLGSTQHFLINCVDHASVMALKTILSFCILSAACTLNAFILDLIGPKQRWVMMIRRNGVMNIAALVLLVVVCGFCYWAALLMYDVQHGSKRAKGSKVQVVFGISYYIIIGSAVSHIVATACNLLRRYSPYVQHNTDEQTQPIMNDMDLETFVISRENSLQETENTSAQQPPPYAP